MLSIQRPQAQVELCLEADKFDQHQATLVRLQTAKNLAGDRPSTEVLDIQERLAAIETEMADATVVFRFRALARKQFAEIETANPPRPDHRADETYSVNTDTIVDALVPHSLIEVREKVSGEQVEFNAADWPTFSDDLTDGQYTAFLVTLLGVNRAKLDAPFSRTESAPTAS
jgi:hypothetical protein